MTTIRTRKGDAYYIEQRIKKFERGKWVTKSVQSAPLHEHTSLRYVEDIEAEAVLPIILARQPSEEDAMRLDITGNRKWNGGAPDRLREIGVVYSFEKKRFIVVYSLMREQKKNR